MNQQTIFDQIDAPARKYDPYSAKQAAAKARPRAQSQAAQLLSALAGYNDGATTRDLQRALFRPEQSAWNKVPTRLLDLARKGLVSRSGETRPDENGQHFLVYEITTTGRDVLGGTDE